MNEYYGLDDFPRDRMWEALESYREAREAYWSATDHEDIMRRAYDEIALMFMEVVTTLVTGSMEPGGSDWRAENENRWTWFLKQLDKHDEVGVLFDQAIEMRVYESVMERLEGARERCIQLASFVLHLGVPPRVIREIPGANFSGDEPHHRTGTKLDGIDWDEHRNGRPWAWVEDDYCMEAFGMYGVLQALGCADRWIHCNVSRNPWALTEVRSTLSARFLELALQDCG